MNPSQINVRRMEPRDLPEVHRIQAASPEASQWSPEEYLGYESFVADREGGLAGFAVARRIPPGEVEVLNVATDPGFRRRGTGAALLRALLALSGEILFLEVRESNLAACELYRSVGFAVVGRRKNYYPSLGGGTAPREDAIVMKMQK